MGESILSPTISDTADIRSSRHEPGFNAAMKDTAHGPAHISRWPSRAVQENRRKPSQPTVSEFNLQYYQKMNLSKIMLSFVKFKLLNILFWRHYNTRF